MKTKRIRAFFAFGTVILLTVTLLILSRLDQFDENSEIVLYGEAHGVESFYKIEFNEWKKYYDKGCRNLFVELPFYSAEFINLWMQEDSDELLDLLFDDIEGTMTCNEYYYDFLHKIKSKCPDTVFYGTDVGHQYDTTGPRYLKYLEEKGLSDTFEYKFAKENIQQGIEFYISDIDNDGIADVREEYMVSNFIDAYERCGGGKVMGIYGSYHTDIFDPKVMGGMLYARYKENLSSITLNSLYFNEYQKPYVFGFCITGLCFLLMLFVPNIVFTIAAKPEGYTELAENENKVLVLFERIGKALVFVSLLIFPSLNPKILLNGGIMFEWDIFIWMLAFVLMILYECYWIKYFAGNHTMENLYSSFAGFPVAGATLPVLAVILLGVYSNNLIVIVSAIILGIGHIGIYANHCKNIE